MELKQLYREIVNEHNLHPVHKGKMEDADLVLRGVNPSCGDDITLYLKLDGDVISGASYDGSGCAISQASVDMMVDQIIDKKKVETVNLVDELFLADQGQIKGKEGENED